MIAVRTKKLLKKIFVTVVTVIVLLFLFEITLRIFFKFKFEPRGRARLPASQTFKLSENKDLLYELLPGSQAEIRGVEIKINAAGFRDKEYGPPESEKTRIVCVGDSVTYGWMVALEDTYHKRLESLLNERGYKAEVLGMGVPGYNTIQEYCLIREKALNFDPDLLLLQIVVNDFERTVSIRTFREGKKLVLVPYHDFTIPFMVKRTGFTYFLMKSSHLFKFVNLRLSWIKTKQDPGFTPRDVFLLGEERSLRYLKKIKSLLDKNDVRFAAVIFPFQQREDIYAYSALHDKIHALFEKIQVPYIDLFETLNSDGGEGLWQSRRHPNKIGYKAASAAIFEFLLPLLEKLEKKEAVENH